MVAGHLQAKKGYYYMVLNLKDEFGKRKPTWIPTGIQVGNKRNEKLAQDLLLETRASYKDPVIQSAVPADMQTSSRRMSGEMLFSDYMISWLSVIKNSIEEITYAGYEKNITKRIVPYFAHHDISLQDLKALDIEGFYEYAFNNLHVKGSTVLHYHANLHKALKFAVKHDLIPSSPMDKVDRPKAQKYMGTFYSFKELEELIRVVKGDPIEFPVLMTAFYGFRREEFCGLRWSSIDFESNQLTINNTVVQFQSEGKTKIIEKERTKNGSSCRSLPLVPQFRDLLLRLKKRQAEARALCGNCYVESDYIYVNDLGVPYKPNYITQHFALVLKKNNLRHIRFHDLRHTCASLLLKSGVSMKDIQEWLGHSSYATTANIYAHLETGSKVLAAQKYDEKFNIDPEIAENVG